MEESRETENILSMIKDYSGLVPNEAHKIFLENCIRKRRDELVLSEKKYTELLKKDENEFSLLIDNAAINETYFFREEIQFDFLCDLFFKTPEDKKLRIWSAACSTGQEPLSVMALALSCGRECELYASDIDRTALDFFRKGVFPDTAPRNDGKKYYGLLKEIADLNGVEWNIKEDVLKKITIFENNLSGTDSMEFFEETLDVILIRNVFIYFPSELRNRILERLASFLVPGGILFVGVNEVPSVEVPEKVPLVKEHTGNIYYFKKTEKKRFSLKKTGGENHKTQNLRAEEKSENSPVQKNKVFETPEEFAKKFYALAAEKAYKEAEELFTSTPASIKGSEYEYYLKGLLFYYTEHWEEAKKQFYCAVILNSEFWPALYELALASSRCGETEEARQYMEKCALILEKKAKNQNSCYNFITDSLNPDYFLELCRKHLEG